MRTFKLPDLGEGLDEAEVVSWHVTVGDHIVSGQPLVSVETAKAVVEIPAPWSGKVCQLHVEAGDVVAVGSELVDVETQDQPEDDAGSVVGEIERGVETSALGPLQKDGHQQVAGLIKASPRTRALASELNIDISKLQGSGPDGAITTDDVRAASQHASQLPGFKPLRGVRRAMAHSLSASKSVISATVTEEADVTDWRSGDDVSVRLIRAIGAGLRAVPILNSWYDPTNASIYTHETIDLGLALATEDGLFAPVLRDTGNLSDGELRAMIEEAKSAVSSRRISNTELQGATITLSNFGMLGGLHASLTVVSPQVAILGAGRLHEAARVVRSAVHVRRVLPLSLTFDHRVITGAEAVAFVAAAKTALESVGID